MYLWYNNCKSISRSTNIVQLFCECHDSIIKCIYTLLKILITLPVTIVTIMSTIFSALKRLKTYLKNKTGQSRSNRLALMKNHANRSNYR